MNKKYEPIKRISKEAYNLIANGMIYDSCSGISFLSDNEYVNIQSYDTKDRKKCKYECHRKYIDIQFILEGEEIIEVFPVRGINETPVYDEDKDISFFKFMGTGIKNVLNKGDFLFVFPGQAHMPCVCVEHKAKVKKAVFKIPVSVLPKLFFMDIDGTLTDGKIYISPSGEVMKAFNIKDGYGIANLLPKNNWIPIVITGRNSEIVKKRAEELGISEVYQGVVDKKEKLIQIAGKYNRFILENGKFPGTAFFGDDIPDLECIKIADIGGCPADAVVEVRKVCQFVSRFKGGDGAGREFIEFLVQNQNISAPL